jgi:RimJ/RimL family protein N-acetyltransferase
MLDVYLRAFSLDDADFIYSLRDMDGMEKIGGVKRFVSKEKDNKWVHDIVMSDGNQSVYLAICQKDTHKIVGYTSIADIDYRNGTCFWSGLKIATAYAGKGYGYQVTKTILKYVFEELRMVRCTAMAIEDHVVAIRMMEKAGYQKEGLMRSYVFKDGIHKNTWLLSILSSEYKRDEA